MESELQFSTTSCNPLFVAFIFLQMKVIFAVLPEKYWGLNGIRTHDIRDTGAMLYQLSFEAFLEGGRGFIAQLVEHRTGIAEVMHGFEYCLSVHSLSAVHSMIISTYTIHLPTQTNAMGHVLTGISIRLKICKWNGHKRTKSQLLPNPLTSLRD